ncbi:MAG TPA: carboxylating nicotinate-nucleotide diphosphorylase [Longimicrobiales bacterium]|nr:carboxylating nicotinate-nucleotide diphosphorylase [Longimicrobiales bacterium]
MEDPASGLLERVRMALAEDVGTGDITTEATIPAAGTARATIRAKASGVLAGVDAARATFALLDAGVTWRGLEDGARLAPGTVVGELEGPARSLLIGERTALNFLQRLSGVATLTRAFVDAVAGTRARILDTRKTTPGLRMLEKAAVRAGGGHSHRAGLYDMVLIKENHIAVAGGIEAAIGLARARAPAGIPIEVEVRDLDELRAALGHAPDRILLDNMTTAMMADAVRLRDMSAAATPELEASGNMSLERVPEVAATGVDFISVGALTHSAPALDMSMIAEVSV